ncbi:MAG: hypothetical protein HN842_03800 [Gammaproteobacteria bacterium]|jgi:TolA-binding protein|nr:hypothetical protein [Gammaproteobacteria bacterium]MBT7307313.1 hypothetical protein [Gammaproteobacteria bacterium]
MYRYLFPLLLLGGSSFSVAAAATSLEQRLEKVERQMSRLTTLMVEVQQLRSDLQQNFGAVEEALHQMELLKKQQSNHYLDLDQRINKLEQARNSKAVGKTHTSKTKKREGESDAFSRAFALVRANKSKQALKALNGVIKVYPKGDYTGDAWYWIGRLHHVGGDEKSAKRAFVAARTALEQVVKSVPGTAKAERAAERLKKIPR